MSDVEVRNDNRPALMPNRFQDKLIMADQLARSGLMPKDMCTKEKVFVALQYGHELGLTPMIAVQNIAVVNGRPSLSADIMKAIAFNKNIFKSYKEEEILNNGQVVGYIVTAVKNNMNTVFTGKFTMENAKTAELLHKDNWRKYPETMLLHRAVSICLRKAIPELLSGLYTPEEAEEIRDVTPPRNETKKPNNPNPVKQEEPPKVEVIKPVEPEDRKLNEYEVKDLEETLLCYQINPEGLKLIDKYRKTGFSIKSRDYVLNRLEKAEKIMATNEQINDLMNNLVSERKILDEDIGKKIDVIGSSGECSLIELKELTKTISGYPLNENYNPVDYEIIDDKNINDIFNENNATGSIKIKEYKKADHVEEKKDDDIFNGIGEEEAVS